MRWVRPTRLPILIAWVVIVGVLYWLGTNPRLLAPLASRVVSQHLLRLDGGGLRARDFRVRAFEGVDLFGVTLTLPGRGGGMTLVSADTVAVDFRLPELLGVMPRMSRVAVSRPQVYSRGGEAVAPGAAERRDPWIRLPRLVIDQLVIRDAFLEFSAADGRLVERLSGIDWRGRVRADERLELELLGCGLAWDTHESLLAGLRGRVVLDADGVQVPRLFGRLNGNPVEVAGRRGWDGSLDIAVRGRGVSAGEVESLIDQTIGFEARGDLDGTFETVPAGLLYQGVFSGELEGYRLTDVSCRAEIGAGEVRLQGLTGNVNGAVFDGTGTFDVGNPLSISFVLEGEVTGVDLARGLVPDEPDLPATDGRGRLVIEHTDHPLWTRVTGAIDDGFIDIVPFENCTFDVEATPDSVTFNRIEVIYRDLQAVLTGVSDSTRVFRGTLDAASEDLATLPAGWGWPLLAGRLYGQGRLEGPLDELGFSGWLSLYDLQLAPLAVRYGEAALLIDDVLGDPVVTAGVEGRGFRLGGVPFGDYLLWGSASSRAARVDSFRAAYGDTAIDLRFQAGFSDSVHQFAVDRFEIDLEGTRWGIEDTVRFALGDGLFSLPDLRLTSEQGTLAANGHYQRGEMVGGSLELRRFDLGLFGPFVPTREPLAGRLSADVVVGGEPETPLVFFNGDLVDAPFALAVIDSLHLAGSFSQGTLEIEGLDLTSDYGRLTGAGTISHPGVGPAAFWPGAELDAELRIEQGNWAFLDQFAIPALDRLSGRFDGDLQLAGSTDDPLCSGRLVSAPFNIHWLHLDHLTGEVRADANTLILGDLHGNQDQLALSGRLEIPMVLDLLSEPVTPPDGPFYMQIDIPAGSDLEPLTRATNAFVQTSGTGGGSVVVAGPLDHPLYQGSLQVRDAGFVLRDLEEVYYGVDIDGVLRGDELILTDISGHEGQRGSLEGEGTVTFAGLVLKTWDVRLGLDRFLVASVPDLRVLVSGAEGRLTGVPVGPDSLLVPKFSGDLEILRARYTGDFAEKPGGVDPLQATVAPDWLADLHLHGEPRSARIVNREMELYMGGDLDLIRDAGGLYLRGALDVNAGRLIVFNNTFEVERGRLDFSRELGFDPQLDLDAATRYRLRSRYSSNSVIEHIGVHLGGTLFVPTIAFTSGRGYSREAIQRMLLGLDPYPTGAGGDADRLRASGITAGFNVLEREIARELNVFDTFEIDQIQRERDTGGTGLDPLIGVGKYIGPDLYLKYAQGVRQDDRDILVEYQINQHLLLQSEIRRRIDENQGQPAYNLDLKYRFEY